MKDTSELVNFFYLLRTLLNYLCLFLPKKMAQMQLAKILNSSQSRVAKMEKGDPTVSLDLLIQSLLAVGATQKNIADALL